MSTHYSTAEETASVIARVATSRETWLQEQLDHINPHRITAEIHKATMPNEQRSLDELESYYRNLSHGSPFARACAELIAEDTAQNAQEFAELTTRAALNRASAQADETAEAVRYAEEQAEIWAHLAYADKWEQIDAHLESNFPELNDDAREAIVDRVCRG